MLVVGDQAPYEDAAVSCCFHLSLWLQITTTNCFFSMRPLGGVQQQNGPDNDLIPEGISSGFYPFLFALFPDVIFIRLSFLPPDG